MRLLLRFLLLGVIFNTLLSASSPNWSGKWNVNWTAGSFILQLEQHGNEVNGTFTPSHGTFEGKIEENVLIAISTNEKNIKNKITLSLSDSGNSFFGNSQYGDWFTGIRTNKVSHFTAVHVDDSTPLKTFYSFLALGNAVRAGNYEMLEKAMDLLQFTEVQNELRHSVKLALAQTFFNIVDECIVNKLNFFKSSAEESHAIVLHQLGTDITVPVSFVQKEGSHQWKIKLADENILQNKLKTLLKANGKHEIDPHANLSLSTPRDTIRTFYEEYDRWEEGGKKYVISTLNLSEVDPAIHEWQAPLLAYYLKSVFDRISTMVFQEIPNNPKSKKPYVHFYHDIANIIIAPYTVEGNTVWQFAPQTLETIDALYSEMENLKEKYPTKVIAENNLYFKLKSTAKRISPWLLHKFNYSEYWQIILLLLIIVLAFTIAWLIRYGVIYLFKRFYITKRWTEEQVTLQYIKPVQIGTFALVLLNGAHQLGLSNIIFSVIKAFTHLLMVISLTWIAYNLITIIFAVMLIHAKRTSTNVDEIIISFVGSILRILIITVALFTIAEIFNIPYKTVVAGLGIGGLAFAIAAKDTIANFFGSAIIIADKPFKTGDRIKIASEVGVITNVGIRSTQIRTIEDTILTIPNNKITQEMIDNYSERQSMRIDTEFYFVLDTPKKALDKLDTEIMDFLKAHEEVDQSKIILTGVNDYTKRGISFGVSFFVKAGTEMQYSDIRHRMMTDMAEIIQNNEVEMVMITVEEAEK